jgi:hypothetical protein
MKEQRDLLKQIAKEQSDARKQAAAEQLNAQQKEEDAAHAKAIQNAIEDAKTQEDKLAILREAQSQTKEGSDEWRAYQKQIDQITKQQEDSAKRRDEAEWNYRYSDCRRKRQAGHAPGESQGADQRPRRVLARADPDRPGARQHRAQG